MNQYIFLILIILTTSYIIIEPFRRNRRRVRKKTRGPRGRRFIRPGDYVRGGWRGGYTYRPKHYWRKYIYNYNPYWYNPFRYFNHPCKDGCVTIGNDGWGCLFPGNGINECKFANDCYGCGR